MDHRRDAIMTRTPRLVLKRWWLVLPLLAVVAGALVYVALDRYGLLQQPSLPVSAQVALFATIWLALALAHELGHAAAYQLLGLGWSALVIRPVGMSVVRERVPTWRQEILIAAVGPSVQVLLGGLVVVIDGTLATMVAAAGVLAVAEGVVNGLVPYPRGSDARKLYRAIAHTVRGRGSALADI